MLIHISRLDTFGLLRDDRPSLSAAIAQRKIEEIQRTGAEGVVTSCP